MVVVSLRAELSFQNVIIWILKNVLMKYGSNKACQGIGVMKRITFSFLKSHQCSTHTFVTKELPTVFYFRPRYFTQTLSDVASQDIVYRNPCRDQLGNGAQLRLFSMFVKRKKSVVVFFYNNDKRLFVSLWTLGKQQ